MKDLLFNKILFVPFLMTGMFALLLSSCDKDEDSKDKSLDVTVNFTGDLKPDAGNVLTLFAFYTKISELNLDSILGPDIFVNVALTQSNINNGVTINLDKIDLDQPYIYIGALIDMDEEEGPSPGDLVELFNDVDILDAILGTDQPNNCHGLNSVVINLDKVLTKPSLDVTVKFTGTTKPSDGDELYVALFYSPLSEFNMDSNSPDEWLSHTLTNNDITNGKTLTITNIKPFADEVYIAAFVDTNGNGPDEDELLECYEDVNFVEALFGEKNATNVAGKTAITINLDTVLKIPED